MLAGYEPEVGRLEEQEEEASEEEVKRKKKQRKNPRKRTGKLIVQESSPMVLTVNVCTFLHFAAFRTYLRWVGCTVKADFFVREKEDREAHSLT